MLIKCLDMCDSNSKSYFHHLDKLVAELLYFGEGLQLIQVDKFHKEAWRMYNCDTK